MPGAALQNGSWQRKSGKRPEGSLDLADRPGREMAEPVQSRLGDVQRLLGILRRRVCQDLEVGADAFPADRSPGAFKSRSRRIASPRAATISGELNRLWQAAS